MAKRKLKVGIIGCGAVGSEIAKACTGILKDKINLVSIFDIDRNKIRRLEKEIGKKIEAFSLNALIAKSEFIVEAASSDVSAKILDLAIKKKKDVMIMSIGGLLKRIDLLKKAEQTGIRVYLPSGALAGIDGLKAAKMSKIDSVTLTTKKPPKGLEGAPYLVKHHISLDNLREESIVFEGNAAQAIKGFPKNINVSALLSLAGIGANKTKVKIIASPFLSRNIHHVEIKGDFGTIETKTENVASPENPKTSYLAVLSAIATLEEVVSTVRIGT